MVLSFSNIVVLSLVFTARRLAKRGIMPSSCVCLSVCVCVCVCVSVTLRYCIKTAKHIITQITPHDSLLTLVFWHQSSLRNLNGITPYGGDKCRWGGLKFVTFDENRAITRQVALLWQRDRATRLSVEILNYKISLLYGIICVILCLAVFTQYQSVTDTHTQKRTDRYTTTACTALA